MTPRIRLTSLRTKMIVFVLPVALLGIGLMTFLAVGRATDAQRASVYAQMTELTAHRAQRVDATAGRRQALTRTAAAALAGYDGADRRGFDHLLRGIIRRTPDVTAIYSIMQPDAFGADARWAGTPRDTKGGRYGPYWGRQADGKLQYLALEGFDDRPWYAGPKATGRDAVLEPYPDTFTKRLMTTYSSPVMRAGKFQGVVAIDVLLDQLTREVAATKVLDSGQAFVVSRQGMLVAARGKGLAGKKTLAQLATSTNNPALDRVAAAIKAGRGGQVETTDPFTGRDAVMTWSPVSTGGWALVTVAPKSEVLAGVAAVRTTLILLGLLALALIAIALVFIAGRLTRPVRGFVDALNDLKGQDVQPLSAGMEAMAQGDLTVAVTPQTAPVTVVGHDEIAVASRTLNEVIDSTHRSVASYNATRDALGAMIGNVARSAERVSEASAQVATSSGESARAVDEIAHAATDLAQGAQRQVDAVDAARGRTVAAVDALAETVRTANATAGAADDAREIAGGGAAAATASSEVMAGVRDASAQVTTAIRSLDEKSGQIGGIVDAITAISEQTNLLALNAAIEAARAGEQGRGFAVVAEEVRKLAEESGKATASISGLIAEIQDETSSAVAVVEDSAKRTAEGARTVEEARAAFERIHEAVAHVSGQIGDIAAQAEQVTLTAQRVQSDVVDVAAVAEQSSASAEQVSASTQQTSASAQEIADHARRLAETAGELQRAVAGFRL